MAKRRFLGLFAIFSLLLMGCGNGDNVPDGYHAVTFDTDGGSEVTRQVVKHGEKIAKPEDPVKEGYELEYWTYNDEEWSFNGYVCTEDMTLKAVWKTQYVKVDFKTVGGPSEALRGLSGSGTYSYGKRITIKASDYKDNGWEFIGWYEGEDLIHEGRSYTFEVKANHTFIAKWKRIPYPIHLDVVEGKGTLSVIDGVGLAGHTITVEAVPDPGYALSYINYGSREILTINHSIDVSTYQKAWMGDVYLYLWNADSGADYQAWPGVKLTYDSGCYPFNFYDYIDGPNAEGRFTHFLLNNGTGGMGGQSQDLLIEDYWLAKQIYIQGSTTQKYGVEASGYFVDGDEFIDGNVYSFEMPDKGVHLEAHFTEGPQ